MTEGGDNGRDQAGRFAAGNAGGPGGSRRRASEFRRAVEEAIGPEHMAAIMRKATKMALEGNLPAMRFVAERVCGRAVDAPVEVEPLGIPMPRLRTAADCDVAAERLVEALCKGAVPHDFARLLIDAFNMRAKTIEVSEQETRLAEMEKTLESVNPHKKRGR
jgi:hypothetical protein